MKRIAILLFTSLFLILSSAIQAQNDEKPWVFGAGFNVVDIRVPTNFSGIVEDYFNSETDADLNYYGVPIRLTAEKHFNRGLSVQLAGSMNKIQRGSHLNDDGIGLTDSNFLYLDAKLKYALANLFNKEDGWFDPFVGVGLGYSFISDYETVFTDEGKGNDLKVNAGGGFNVWIKPNFGLSFDTNYNHNFINTFGDNEGGTGTDFFQHTVGILYRPNSNNDSDGDQIKDRNDKCPQTYGVAEYDGCPIPDADGDGVLDKDDACPKVSGVPANNGCPWKDTDKDGIFDKDDACPNVSGPLKNKGCPWKDTDGDGVLDKDDACPKVSGVQTNDGCPKKVVDIKIPKENPLTFSPITLHFDLDSHKIKIDHETKLMNAIYFMRKSNALFVIEGHTDSGGSLDYNQILSDKRANAVKKYLISEGVAIEKLVLIGYGENRPESDNITATGRATNRRATISIME